MFLIELFWAKCETIC